MNAVDEIAKRFFALSAEEKALFLKKLEAQKPSDSPTAQAHPEADGAASIPSRFSHGCYCPYCGSVHVSRFGRQADGTQRYRCKDCRKTFQANSRTVLRKLSLDNRQKLRKYVHCMCLELPIRRTALECEISRPTAFAWRHKILDALAQFVDKQRLSGIVECDETFFPLSFKGHRRMGEVADRGIPLPSHKRGGAYVRKGLGRRSVCVPVAVSTQGTFTGKVSNLGVPTAQDVRNVLDGRCTEDVTLCSDGGQPIRRFAAHEHLRQVVIKGGKGTKAGCGIQRVNAFHAGLKTMVDRKFKGVATKYLNNYVVWYGFLHVGKIDPEERESLLYEIALTATCPSTTRSVTQRVPVPVLSKVQQKMMEHLLLRLAYAECIDRQETYKRLRKGILDDLPDQGEFEDIPF